MAVALWSTTLRIDPGEVSIVARAWDTTAAAQPDSRRQLWNPKGYVNKSWPRVHIHVYPAPPLTQPNTQLLDP